MPASRNHSRVAARSRTLATIRASTVAPGNSTLASTSRAVARSNSTLGRSAAPRPGVEPPEEPELDTGLTEVAVAEAGADLGLVVPADLGVPIELEAAESLGNIARQSRRPQLLGYLVDRSKRHVARILQEGAQEPHGRQLNGHAEAVVIPTASGDEIEVGLVEVEEPAQLRRRRFPSETAVAATLLGTQEFHRHEQPPPSARLLRH